MCERKKMYVREKKIYVCERERVCVRERMYACVCVREGGRERKSGDLILIICVMRK